MYSSYMLQFQIGRASGRERGWQDVEKGGGGGGEKKKKGERVRKGKKRQ